MYGTRIHTPSWARSSIIFKLRARSRRSNGNQCLQCVISRVKTASGLSSSRSTRLKERLQELEVGVVSFSLSFMRWDEHRADDLTENGPCSSSDSSEWVMSIRNATEDTLSRPEMNEPGPLHRHYYGIRVTSDHRRGEIFKLFDYSDAKYRTIGLFGIKSGPSRVLHPPACLLTW